MNCTQCLKTDYCHKCRSNWKLEDSLLICATCVYVDGFRSFMEECREDALTASKTSKNPIWKCPVIQKFIHSKCGMTIYELRAIGCSTITLMYASDTTKFTYSLIKPYPNCSCCINIDGLLVEPDEE